jgi:hypothetical protein
MTELSRIVTELYRIPTDLSRIVTELRRILTELRHTKTDLHRTLSEICCDGRHNMHRTLHRYLFKAAALFLIIGENNYFNSLRTQYIYFPPNPYFS